VLGDELAQLVIALADVAHTGPKVELAIGEERRSDACGFRADLPANDVIVAFEQKRLCPLGSKKYAATAKRNALPGFVLATLAESFQLRVDGAFNDQHRVLSKATAQKRCLLAALDERHFDCGHGGAVIKQKPGAMAGLLQVKEGKREGR